MEFMFRGIARAGGIEVDPQVQIIPEDTVSMTEFEIRPTTIERVQEVWSLVSAAAFGLSRGFGLWIDRGVVGLGGPRASA